MRRAVQTVTRAFRDFALGIHLANGIRHGVPQRTEKSRCPASRQSGAERAAPDGPVAPVFTQLFVGPAVVSSSRV
ncbi:hypothetical protein [Nocardia carnea]|uniref:Transposase n=1 Tax=Nocardia carnea TaxID=37328 RepID=A0ABW7TEX9_9NOCA|nr:hypothetical protein [Nocardia carnea]